MFIEPTITWVPSGFSGYIWLDTKIVLKKKKNESSENNLKIYSKLIRNLITIIQKTIEN